MKSGLSAKQTWLNLLAGEFFHFTSDLVVYKSDSEGSNDVRHLADNADMLTHCL